MSWAFGIASAVFETGQQLSVDAFWTVEVVQ